MTKTNLLAQMQTGWENFNAYIKTLDAAQLTTLTDAAGWTVKDHLAHLATWEDGTYGVLQSECHWERMGVSQEAWTSGGWDPTNAAIYQQHLAKSLAEVQQLLAANHQRLVEKIQTLTEADLQRPYNTYQPGTTWEAPIVELIAASTYQHYAEHQPWIEAIAQGTAAS
ncbi:MAG TPA: ClbS/DfsB family four-helix bundle protein [Phototrophicaceae bacterium]|nr:ClbS/DfsB family four-helix bundle protein [Phototrophicaceae bacterium]